MAAAGALAVMAAIGFGRFSYTLLLPPMREGLRLSYTAAGLLASANLAGYLAGSLAAGRLARRFGGGAATRGALCLLALSLAWTGAAAGAWDAGAARALAGAAGAVVYVQALGLVPAWFPEGARGLASGAMHAGIGAGLVLTGLGLPLLIGIAPATGWRAGWAALALVAAAVLPLGWRFLKAPPALPGTDGGHPPGAGREGRASDGSDLPSLATYGGLYALFGISYVIYVTFFAETLRARGLTPSQTGLAWAALGALSLGSGPLCGSLSDRLGRLQGLAVVFGLQGVAYVALLHGTGAGLIFSVALFGITAWGIPAVMAATMGQVVRPEDTTVALARVTVWMGTGQAAGPVLAGALTDATGIVSAGLWLSALAAACGAGFSFRQALAGKQVQPAP